jgi:hypothetical protein
MKNLLLILGLTLVVSAMAQRNFTKVSMSDAVLKTAALSQERLLTDRISLQGGIKLRPNCLIPGAGYSQHYYPDPARNPFINARMKAVSVSAELRIYGKGKQGSGFYYGAFVNAASFRAQTGEFNYDFKEPVTTAVYTAVLQQEMSLKMAGGGLQLGVQKKLNKKMILDWTILGIGIGHMKLNGRMQVLRGAEGFNLQEYNLNTADASMSFEKYFPLQKTAEAQAIILKGSGVVPVLRMGVAIGFAY